LSLHETLILSIDTATLAGSVSLTRGAEMLISILGEPQVSHSSTLLRDIDRALAATGISLAEVELFAAAAGLGSFTGLRIGLATVKAFAANLNRPCIGIPTLHAVARAGGLSKSTVALLPAGRGELFAQLLSVSATGAVAAHDDPVHLPPAMVLERYAELPEVKWAGAGAHTYRDLISEQAARLGFVFSDDASLQTAASSPGWRLAPREGNLALEVAALALQRTQHGDQQSHQAESLRAIYVRPSDPELREHCQ